MGTRTRAQSTSEIKQVDLNCLLFFILSSICLIVALRVLSAVTLTCLGADLSSSAKETLDEDVI